MVGRSRDDASTSAIGLSVAAALFAIAFVTANLMVAEPAGKDLRSAALDTTAATALGLVIGQAGAGPGGGAWVDSPDGVVRFGLADEGTHFLDYRKIKSMRNASMTSTANAAPDYADVRGALGITEGDFHLRTYPVIPGYDDPRWTKEPRGRYAYVGHDMGVATPIVPAGVTTYANTSSNALNVSLAIRNDGSQPFLFSASIGLGKIGTGVVLVEEERHTRLLAAGAVDTLWVEFPRMAYTGEPDGVIVTVTDALGRVVDGPTWTSATLASSGTTHALGVKLAAGERFYTVGESVTFRADRYDGSGSAPNSAVTWRFVMVGPNGDEWTNETLTLPKKKPASFVCTNCTTEGLYVGHFYNSGSPFTPELRARDVVEVLSSAPSAGTPSFGGVAANEIQILQELVAGFNPALYDAATSVEGDLFDDAQKVRDLPAILSRYSTLIIGSEVEQNALNSGDIKWAIADWVIGGGNLVVLGRADGHANWLQPVYKASIAGAGGGIGVPDPTHPVLVSPNRLDYQRYTDRGLAWGIREDQPFTHILTKGMAGNERQDALAIANPGAYNEGTVVLTSYMVGALTEPQDPAEAKRFLHNLLSQSYTMLFLDYGPSVPSGTPIGSAQRLVAIPHPNVPGAVVEVRIVMYSWT